MNSAEKIRVLLAYRNMNMREVAKRMHISQQSLSHKMLKNSFKEDELTEIAEICNATFEGVFTLNDTKKRI
ncbi:MAG: helix-turn-helix transcriptional regulator [Clostridia bacterium]|nr:helix-turn-helix transcriptional regulator [Clostridia bacterium]